MDSAAEETQKQPLELGKALEVDIFVAAEDAYRRLTEKGYSSEEVHRLGVCHQAASYMVTHLLANGHKVEHEIRSGWTVVEHSYVTLDTGLGEEIIIDPTWQQFLPKGKPQTDAPKVLTGTRHDVIEQARRFGVDELTLQLWGEQGFKMTVAQQQSADAHAAEAADMAAQEGAWDKFMSTTG